MKLNKVYCGDCKYLSVSTWSFDEMYRCRACKNKWLSPDYNTSVGHENPKIINHNNDCKWWKEKK